MFNIRKYVKMLLQKNKGSKIILRDYKVEEKVIFPQESNFNPRKEFDKLLVLYNSANNVKQFNEIEQIERRLCIVPSKFILLEENTENGDIFYDLRLLYFDDRISEKSLMLSADLSQVDRCIRFYSKAIPHKFPVKILPKNSEGKYAFESFDTLENFILFNR